MTDARENQPRPIVCVGAVIFKGHEVLLIKRGKPPKKGDWSIPGGAQEIGETVNEALHREVAEETGLTVKIMDFLDVIDFLEAHPDGRPRFHYTLLDYSADYVSGTPTAASDATDCRFFTLDQIATLPLWTETRRVIELAAKKRGLKP